MFEKLQDRFYNRKISTHMYNFPGECVRITQKINKRIRNNMDVELMKVEGDTVVILEKEPELTPRGKQRKKIEEESIDVRCTEYELEILGYKIHMPPGKIYNDFTTNKCIREIASKIEENVHASRIYLGNAKLQQIIQFVTYEPTGFLSRLIPKPKEDVTTYLAYKLPYKALNLAKEEQY